MPKSLAFFLQTPRHTVANIRRLKALLSTKAASPFLLYLETVEFPTVSQELRTCISPPRLLTHGKNFAHDFILTQAAHTPSGGEVEWLLQMITVAIDSGEWRQNDLDAAIPSPTLRAQQVNEDIYTLVQWLSGRVHLSIWYTDERNPGILWRMTVHTNARLARKGVHV